MARQRLRIYRCLSAHGRHQGATEECDELALTLGRVLHTRRGSLGKRCGGLLYCSRSLARRGTLSVFLHDPYKAIAIAPAALDELLRPPTVANGPTGQRNAAFERRITDELARPHLPTQLILRDHLVAMLEEILQHMKRLGSQPHSRPRPVQGIEPGIENTLGKDIAHATNPPYGVDRLQVCCPLLLRVDPTIHPRRPSGMRHDLTHAAGVGRRRLALLVPLR